MKYAIILSFFIMTVSCQTDRNKVELAERKKQDSLTVIKREHDLEFVANIKAKQQEKESLKYEAEMAARDFDMHFRSNKYVHFDKNNVPWTVEKQNDLRFVIKKKDKLLIVYKNGKELKKYLNPKISNAGKEISLNSSFLFFDSIIVNAKEIFNKQSFAPDGLNNHTEYYILENSL